MVNVRRAMGVMTRKVRRGFHRRPGIVVSRELAYGAELTGDGNLLLLRARMGGWTVFDGRCRGFDR